MEEKDQYEIFKDLMIQAMEYPNEINNICIQVITSLAKMANKTEEEFREITAFMEESYHDLGDLHDILMIVMAMKVMRELEVED